MRNELDSETVVYPFCYKIKETCIPNDNNNLIDCLKELSNILRSTESHINLQFKNKYVDNLFDCLKKYGDIYKKLDIELYVNPKTKKITFPDNERIQSNLNIFIKNTNFDTLSPDELDIFKYKISLYNILLNNQLRKNYNDFYYSSEYSELDSVTPKEYGIARIMGPENVSNGGKKKKYIISKSKKIRKHKFNLKRSKSKRKM